jgi:hypothetical protein
MLMRRYHQPWDTALRMPLWILDAVRDDVLEEIRAQHRAANARQVRR